MNKLLGLLLIFGIISSGCNTAKRMQKQIGKIHVTHPELLMQYCANEYPIKETVKVIQGKDSLIYNTITVDCDSAFAELQKQYPNEPIEVIRERLKTVYVPKIETKHRVDTIVRVQENTAEIEATRMKISGLQQAYSIQSAELAKAKKKASTMAWIVAGMAVLFAGGFVLRVKNII